MARSRYRILQAEHPHFLTCTVLNWIPLFTRPATVQVILDALLYRQQHHAWQIYGYVILENHLHLLLQADDLANQLAHFKSYSARQLIDYLREAKAERLLEQLKWFRKAHKTDRDYQQWEEGSHPQLIDNPEVLRQKLDYIHFNPVKRGYVDLPEHWRYSSARDYAGMAGLLPVYRDWFQFYRGAVDLHSHAARGNEGIHCNPVKRGFVDLPEHWRYSSARDYAGIEGLLPVYREWF